MNRLLSSVYHSFPRQRRCSLQLPFHKPNHGPFKATLVGDFRVTCWRVSNSVTSPSQKTRPRQCQADNLSSSSAQVRRGEIVSQEKIQIKTAPRSLRYSHQCRLSMAFQAVLRKRYPLRRRKGLLSRYDTRISSILNQKQNSTTS